MVFDPTDPQVGDDEFPKHDWSHTSYSKYTDDVPKNDPSPKGTGFKIVAIVDLDYAGDMITRRSRTGFLMILNNLPIYWLSKKQSRIETSLFSSKFMAMKHAVNVFVDFDTN